MIIKKNNALTITELIQELFKTHGFESEEYDGWIIPNGNDYAMKGYWYPEATESTGQLTIEVFINSEMIMVESFAGIGETGVERLKNAFASFLHHAFPTFLSAVWKKSSDAVTTETWTIGDNTYTAYLGNQGILNYDKEKQLTVPESYSSRIKELISSQKLDKEIHWFNLFYANMNGLDTYTEVLKDNIKWTEGSKILGSLNWKRSNSYYAVRQFLILKNMNKETE